MCSPYFLCLLCFLEQLIVFKNKSETSHSFWIKMFLVTPKVLAMVVLWEKKKTKTQVWRSYNWKQNIFLQICFDVSMHFHISIKRKPKKKIYLLLCSKFKSFVGEKKNKNPSLEII